MSVKTIVTVPVGIGPPELTMGSSTPDARRCKAQPPALLGVQPPKLNVKPLQRVRRGDSERLATTPGSAPVNARSTVTPVGRVAVRPSEHQVPFVASLTRLDPFIQAKSAQAQDQKYPQRD